MGTRDRDRVHMTWPERQVHALEACEEALFRIARSLEKIAAAQKEPVQITHRDAEPRF